MPYQVVLPKKVEKDLSKIPTTYRFRIVKALIGLEEDPYIGKQLSGERKNEWSYRVWPYRIIYQIYKKELIVLIIAVGHRQGVYKH